ncbi:MAG TPA: (d)CMP kinase, partial [Lachnospiraceae bacterium]|nr:(d)CMP kinase [Lachnospiraceae bacterium]
MSFAIAIDGPAGAGKSSAARQAAQKLQFVYVDTGAMYRTIALYMLENRVDTDDEEALKAALDSIRIELKYKDGVQCMYLNGEDVSGRIRTPEVSAQASVVAAIPAVRAKLLDLQRNMAASQNVLMDGRDIGTNILPDAELKIYLTASVEERARRRFLELTQKGEECSLEEIQKDIADRDWRDM